MFGLPHRILPLLQLTRMALVFTAIADSACTLLLRARYAAGDEGSILAELRWDRVLAIAFVSFGLYGYGMSLNDIIDRRRDQLLASHRPLPSGRVGVLTAHVICGILALVALAGGIYYAATMEQGWKTLVLLVGTGFLITFYDAAGKYLIGLGLLTLGLIRFFHAAVPAPHLPVVWHPLLLLNHVTILSAICYRLEDKRPALSKGHFWGVLASLAALNLAVPGLVALRRMNAAQTPISIQDALWIDWGLMAPAGMAILFLGVALWTWRRYPNPREAGQNLMLYGLLWLIVYDAAFVGGYVGWVWAAVVVMLFPVAYFSVQFMRWWGKVLALSQQPEFKRA